MKQQSDKKYIKFSKGKKRVWVRIDKEKKDLYEQIKEQVFGDKQL